MLEASRKFTQDRITDLKAKLRARQGRPEYRENIPALEAEIARLESRLRDGEQA